MSALSQGHSKQSKNVVTISRAESWTSQQNTGSEQENRANQDGVGREERATNHMNKSDSRSNARGDQTNKRPFTSGRDLFVQEGGTLPPKSQKRGRGEGSIVEVAGKRTFGGSNGGHGQSSQAQTKESEDYQLPQELEGLDKGLVQKIESEILHKGQDVRFRDIAGLKHAKSCVIETIVWPIQSPHLFTGMRSVPKGVLLFGPPGTGKTLVGSAIANEAGATFFAISASSLMSKWIGEGEKPGRVLFAVACYHEPAVVFLDEVDSSRHREVVKRMKRRVESRLSSSCN